MTETASGKIMLKKLKELNTIWHPDSTLVFKSKDEKLVIGRWVDSALIDLDDTAIQLCETWKFKIDESLVEQTSEVETEEEVKEEEVEEDQVSVVGLLLPVEVSDAILTVEVLVKKTFGLLQKELDDTKQKLQSKTDEFDALQGKFSALKSLLA